MKHLLALLLVLPLMAIAADKPKDVKSTKNKNGTMTLLVSKDKVKECIEKGGCSLITFEDFSHAIDEVAEAICGQGKSVTEVK